MLELKMLGLKRNPEVETRTSDSDHCCNNFSIKKMRILHYNLTKANRQAVKVLLLALNVNPINDPFLWSLNITCTASMCNSTIILVIFWIMISKVFSGTVNDKNIKLSCILYVIDWKPCFCTVEIKIPLFGRNELIKHSKLNASSGSISCLHIH